MSPCLHLQPGDGNVVAMKIARLGGMVGKVADPERNEDQPGGQSNQAGQISDPTPEAGGSQACEASHSALTSAASGSKSGLVRRKRS